MNDRRIEELARMAAEVDELEAFVDELLEGPLRVFVAR